MKMKSSHRRIYNPAMRFLKKLARTSLLGAGLYILLPTPDGVIIHPLFGSLFSHISGMSFKQGIVISIVTYTAIGVILCLIGVRKQIYRKLKTRFTARHNLSLAKRLLNFKYHSSNSSNDTTCPCSP